MNTKGLEIKPFDAPLLRQRLQSLLRYKPDAITVSLMNSFANAAHEVEAAEICKEMFPGVPISISSQVLPELMEYGSYYTHKTVTDGVAHAEPGRKNLDHRCQQRTPRELFYFEGSC